LHGLAESEAAALVVVGSTHVGTLGRVLPGATGERLLHGASCPVAIVPDGYRSHSSALATIGVAYDGSTEAAAAVSAAAGLAQAFGARLEVTGVLPPDPAYGAGELMGGSADPALRAVLRDDLRDALDAVTATLPEAIDSARVLLEGDPAEWLIERSAELDLLVIGSRGYGPLRAVLVGAVSGRVARAAHCPVVVTPRGVEAPLRELFDAGDATAV
jgi:nucleotide-binding universal stress UspA family protein